MHEIHDMTIVDRLVADLAVGRIRSLAFVVPIDTSMTLPLYEVAIETVRRGWERGLDDVRYWFITPEPEPPASFGSSSCAGRERLESEGITFIGSTYPEVEHGVVLLDPQGERIRVDRIVSLRDGAAQEVSAEQEPQVAARADV